jgi:hypothetical protein
MSDTPKDEEKIGLPKVTTAAFSSQQIASRSYVEGDGYEESEEEKIVEGDGGSFERSLQRSGRGSMALVLPHVWINKSGPSESRP